MEAPATEALRARLKAQRLMLRAILFAAEERAGSRLTLRIGPAVAQQLGVAEGDLVEVPRDNGPSLLAWAHIAADVPMDACALAASTASLLRIEQDDPILLRRVHDPRS